MLTLSGVSTTVKTCKQNYWAEKGVASQLTSTFRNQFARMEWLQKKKNPAGWTCAQRRFTLSFTKLMKIYTNNSSSNNNAFPDYLVIVDADTCMNIDHVTNYLLTNRPNPNIPLPTTPIVFAGCRVRSPDHQIKWTFPWGGYGTFISKGSLQRWTQPIDCDLSYNDKTATTSSEKNEFARNICNKYTNKYEKTNSSSIEKTYPFSATIGEEGYFENSNSLNDAFYKYIHKEEFVCLHSDWFFGYFSNFLNLFTHVNHNKSQNEDASTSTADYFDKYHIESIVPENRLHTIMESEMYRYPGEGLCNHKSICNGNSSICHGVNEKDMERIHKESSRSQQ